MELDFLLELTVWQVLTIVVAGILLDAVLGVLNTFKPSEENFDIRKLPQFIAQNVFPYVGGLAAVALVADRVGEPYNYVFYFFAVSVVAKYVAEIKDKLFLLFGVNK